MFPVLWSGLTGGWVDEIKNGLIAAAEGDLYKLTSDLTQLEKNVKLVLKSPRGVSNYITHMTCVTSLAIVYVQFAPFVYLLKVFPISTTVLNTYETEIMLFRIYFLFLLFKLLVNQRNYSVTLDVLSLMYKYPLTQALHISIQNVEHTQDCLLAISFNIITN